MFSGDGVGERRWCGAEGVFRCEQEAVALVARVGCEQEVTASGSKRGGGGTTRIERVRGSTIEGASEQDGAVSALSEVDEVGYDAAPARKGSVGIDDEQDDAFGGDGVF